MINYSIIIKLGVKFSTLTSSNRFVALTSRLSIVGITLGVATLITVLAVMRGFESEIRQSLVSDFDQLHVYAYTDHYPQELIDHIASLEHVVTVSKFAKQYGLVRVVNDYMPIVMLAFDDKSLGDGVYLAGNHYAEYEVGERFHMMLPAKSQDQAAVVDPIYSGKYPHKFSTGGIAAFVTSLDHYAQLAGQHKPSGLTVVVDDIYFTDTVKEWLSSHYPGLYHTYDWKDKYEPFFAALRTQRSLMVFVLSMIILVALFGKVSGLIMMSADKRSEIALLQTMGMSQRQIQAVFLVQGAIISSLGVVLGVVSAMILCHYATEITQWLESFLGTTLVDPRVYGVSELPVLLDLPLILSVSLSAFLIGLLASFYPARSASRLSPSEVLRYG